MSVFISLTRTPITMDTVKESLWTIIMKLMVKKTANKL